MDQASMINDRKLNLSNKIASHIYQFDKQFHLIDSAIINFFTN
jgi:hypothetical protein